MDWDDLRFVLAVGREGTLTAAAGALGVTHTTVGRRVARLEEELGVRLFDRTPGGFVPTDAGTELVEAAVQVERQLLRVEGSLKGQDHQLEGPLRVTTLDFVFEASVDVFASFCEAHPGVELTVSTSPTERSLFRREADVALRMTNTPPDTLIGRRVGSVDFALYGHRDLAAAAETWSELPWLHWDRHHVDVVRWMDGWLEEVAPGARVALRLGEDTLVRRASVRAGIGVHPLPLFEGDALPDVVRIGPVLRPLRRQLWLLMLPALRNNRRVRAFVDHVSDALLGHPALGR